MPKTMPRSRTQEEWGYGRASFAVFSFTSLFYCRGGGDQCYCFLRKLFPQDLTIGHENLIRSDNPARL